MFDRHENVARLVIETHLGGRVTDLLDTVSNDLLVVDLGFGGDLSEDCRREREEEVSVGFVGGAGSKGEVGWTYP